MTDFFYGNGGNDGSSGLDFANRRKTPQHALDNASAGDRFRMCAEAIETVSSELNVDTTPGTNQLAITFVGASGVDGSLDGSIYTIQASAAMSRVMALENISDYYVFDGIKFDANNNANWGVECTSGFAIGTVFIRCEFLNAKTESGLRLQGDAGATAQDCLFHDNAEHGIRMDGSGTEAVGCSFYNNMLANVFMNGNRSNLSHSIIYGGSAEGVLISSAGDGAVISFCTIFNPAASGVFINSTSANATAIRNTSISDCGGYALQVSDTSYYIWRTSDYLHTHNNTSGDTNSTRGLQGIGNVTGDPLFTDTTPGSEDFQPQSGSPLIAAGLRAITIGGVEPAASTPTFASVDDVRLNVDRGDGQLGTVRLPSINDVRLAVVFDANDSLTGNVRLPSINDVRLATVFDSLDSLTGNVRLPTTAQVVDGVVYDTLDSLTGTFTCEAAAGSGVVGRKLKQQAVYWAPDTLDKYGRQDFVGGVDLVVRWQDVQQLFVDANGDERTSRAIAYFDSTSDDLRINGRLYLGNTASLTAGELADPTLVDNAWVIQQLQDSPSLRAGETLGKVFM